MAGTELERICKRCQGGGRVEVMAFTILTANSGLHGTSYRCSICNGKGRLLPPAEELATKLCEVINERDRLREALIKTGRATGALLADSVSTDFLMEVPENAELYIKAQRDKALEEAASLCVRSLESGITWIHPRVIGEIRSLKSEPSQNERLPNQYAEETLTQALRWISEKYRGDLHAFLRDVEAQREPNR
jgi:hypothetical protein